MATTKTFHYNSIDASGRKSKGTVEAPTEAAATSMLRGRGETPLGMIEAGQGLQRDLKIPGFGNKTKLKDLAVFSRQFATMTASGMSLLRSLSIMEEQTVSVPLKKAVGEMQGGRPRAASRCPRRWPSTIASSRA